MAELQIRTKDNGPYIVKGPFELVDADGNRYEVEEGKTVYLCRCGGSQNKPFCDSTHSRIGFEAANRAVERHESQTGAEDSDAPAGEPDESMGAGQGDEMSPAERLRGG